MGTFLRHSVGNYKANENVCFVLANGGTICNKGRPHPAVELMNMHVFCVRQRLQHLQLVKAMLIPG